MIQLLDLNVGEWFSRGTKKYRVGLKDSRCVIVDKRYNGTVKDCWLKLPNLFVCRAKPEPIKCRFETYQDGVCDCEVCGFKKKITKRYRRV